MTVLRSLILSVLVTLLLIPTLYACAETIKIPSSGPNVASFIPMDFTVTNEFKNDFNGDGLVDSLIVIASKSEEERRILLVLFKNVDGSYGLSARADEIMMGSGGIHSGPFGEIEIRKSTFVVTQFTGSTKVQNSSHSQFQFRNGGWHLIGNKLTANMSEGEEERAGLKAPPEELIVSYAIDKNFLNGDQEEVWKLFSTVTEKERTVVKRRKQKVKPLVRLEKFTDASAY